MSKFVIECPNCGKYAEASTGFFARKKIDCLCGYTINVRTDKMTSRTCPHCGNNVIFDQSKGENALCPVCGEKINTTGMIFNKVEFHCPSCSCGLSADKNAVEYICPMCDTVIDVQKQVAKQNEKDKGLASVIKYEGDNETFVWKHPIEDFNLGSQLIVHESQEAIFFRDGQALDLFGAGRYTLATQNLPILEELYKLPTNADTPFHSEVYFVNLTTQMGIKWGTDSKVRMFDPATGLHIEIGAYGNFNIKVCDSRKLVIKLVGTAGGLKQSEIIDEEVQMRMHCTGSSVQVEIKSIMPKFKALIMTKVKANLARIIKDNNINILEVDEHLDTISEKLRDEINPVLVEYGLVIPEFFVTGISTPDDDPNFKRLKQQHADMYLKVRQEQVLTAEAQAAQGRKLLEAETAAKLRMMNAQGEAEAMRIKAMAEADAYKAQAFAEAEEMKAKGYTYQQETQRKVGVGAVENMGGSAGGELGGLAGLGISLGAMGGVMNMTREAMSPLTNNANALGSGISASISGTNVTNNSQAIQINSADKWDCTCGNKNIVGGFCNLCGNKKPAPVETWDCSCGNKGIVGGFCNMCGSKKPEPVETWDCACGNKGIVGMFCNMCGSKKPEPVETWDCTCGNKGIVGMFCNMCGSKKPEPVQTWDCSCGNKGIIGNFCTNCGKKKGE